VITYTGTNGRTHAITHYENAFITKKSKNYSYDGQLWIGNEIDHGIKFISHPEGYIKPNFTSSGVEMDYVFQYKDHLGNIRLSYKDKNQNDPDLSVDLEILEENNCYPFGLRHKGYNNVVNGTHHPYTFGGKEEQEELGLNWHDFHTRNYDASLGRWMNIDPLAQDYFNNSPYNYVANTPLIAYDPDGKRIAIVGSEEFRKEVFMHLINLALQSETGAEQFMNAVNSDKTLVIFDPSNSNRDHLSLRDAGGDDEAFGFDLSRTNENLDSQNGRNGEELEANSSTKLGHELAHFNSNVNGELLENGRRSSNPISAEEVTAVEIENKIRKELGLNERTHYKNINVHGMQATESQYEGYYELSRKSNYAEVAKGNARRGEVVSGSFNTKTQTRGLYYRGGKFLGPVYVKKPMPQKEKSISK